MAQNKTGLRFISKTAVKTDLPAPTFPNRKIKGVGEKVQKAAFLDAVVFFRSSFVNGLLRAVLGRFY